MVEGRALAQPVEQRRGALEARPRSSRCAGSSAPRRQRRDLAGQQAQARAPPCSVEESNSSCMPRHSPSTGVPSPARSTTSSSRPARAAAASPRRTRRRRARRGRRRSASASWSAVRRARRRRARAPSRRCGGCPSRSRRSRSRHCVSVPLVEGTPVSVGSMATAARSARANALKPPRSCGARWSGLQVEVQRHARGVGHRAEELLGHLVLEAADAPGGSRPSKRQSAARRRRSRSGAGPSIGTSAGRSG